MIDVVGTLSQPYLALIFLLYGIGIGVFGCVVKSIFHNKKKVTLVIGDFISTFILCLAYLLLSFFYTKGVFYAYSLLTITIGYTLSYFTLKKLIRKIKLFIQKKHANN